MGEIGNVSHAFQPDGVNPYAKLGGRPKGAINKTARELAVMAKQCYEVCVRFAKLNRERMPDPLAKSRISA